MKPYAEPPQSVPSKRPVISEVSKDATGGSSFTVTFLPGQVLPTHRNASRILINVLSGEGSIVVSDDRSRSLAEGAVVQIDANAPHSLLAGDSGLLIQVHLVADCCANC